MISIFITVVVAIALIATMGYSIFSLQKAADIASITQRNVARMESMVSLVRASARPAVAGGAVRLPMGDLAPAYPDGPSRTVLPGNLVGDDRTPWGGRYGYCPSAVSDGAADQLDPDLAGAEVASGAGSYAVATKRVAGLDYVVTAAAPAVATIGGPGPAAPVLGFIVSPAPNQFDIPLCNEIIYRDGAYLIGIGDADDDGAPDGSPTYGGTVAIIPLGLSSLAFAASDMDPTLFVAIDAPAGRTGTSEDDAMLLTEAVDYWRSSQPRSLSLELSDGSYDVGAIDLSFLAAAPGRFIRITDSSPETPTGATLTSSTQKFLTFGADGALDGVTLSETIGVRTLPGARVSIDASVLGELRVDGGDVELTSRSSIEHVSRPGSPIGVAGGYLALSEAPGDTALSISSSSTAIVVLGGRVGVSTNIEALDSPLPWRVTGSGRIDIGLTLAGAAPTVDYDGTHEQVVAVKDVVGSEGSSPAAGSCPATQPYVVQASCRAGSGALRSSSLVPGAEQGWACSWASDLVGGAGAIPLPTDAAVDLVCGVNPSN